MFPLATITLSGDDISALLNSPLVLSAAGALFLYVISKHPLHALAELLRAKAAHATGLLKTLEEGVADDVADPLDDFLTKNSQSEKDLMDPAKRAAAKAALMKQAELEAEAAIAAKVAGKS
jgi:hypothetical protein